MIDHFGMHLAMRARALTLSVVTTGSTSLSATSTGYERASGSFLTDGFAPGMEVTGTSFSNAANNAAKTITAVTATALTCPGCVTETAGTRTLSVGLPSTRVWENLVPATAPTVTDPYVLEQYLPGPAARVTVGSDGQLEVEPLYVLSIYGVANTDVAALRQYVDALLLHFAPDTVLTLSNGDLVRVRGNPAPFAGQLLRREDAPGWVVASVNIPFRCRTAPN